MEEAQHHTPYDLLSFNCERERPKTRFILQLGMKTKPVKKLPAKWKIKRKRKLPK